MSDLDFINAVKCKPFGSEIIDSREEYADIDWEFGGHRFKMTDYPYGFHLITLVTSEEWCAFSGDSRLLCYEEVFFLPFNTFRKHLGGDPDTEAILKDWARFLEVLYKDYPKEDRDRLPWKPGTEVTDESCREVNNYYAYGVKTPQDPNVHGRLPFRLFDPGKKDPYRELNLVDADNKPVTTLGPLQDTTDMTLGNAVFIMKACNDYQKTQDRIDEMFKEISFLRHALVDLTKDPGWLTKPISQLQVPTIPLTKPE